MESRDVKRAGAAQRTQSPKTLACGWRAVHTAGCFFLKRRPRVDHQHDRASRLDLVRGCCNRRLRASQPSINLDSCRALRGRRENLYMKTSESGGQAAPKGMLALLRSPRHGIVAKALLTGNVRRMNLGIEPNYWQFDYDGEQLIAMDDVLAEISQSLSATLGMKVTFTPKVDAKLRGDVVLTMRTQVREAAVSEALAVLVNCSEQELLAARPAPAAGHRRIYTVIVGRPDYLVDKIGGTYMTSMEAANAAEAGDLARKECSLADADDTTPDPDDYVVHLVIAGTHNDLTGRTDV